MTTASETGVAMKFEIVVIPVSDVDRAKRFYGGLGWRLDADFAAGSFPTSSPPATSCLLAASRSARFSMAAATCTPARTSPICLGGAASAARIPSTAATARSPRSKIRTAMAGCSRRSPRDCPDASTRTIRHSPHRPSLRPRSGVQRPRTASTRNGPVGTMRTGPTGTPTTSFGSRPASRCRLRQRPADRRLAGNCAKVRWAKQAELRPGQPIR